jgi:3'-5' exoribonuclease
MTEDQRIIKVDLAMAYLGSTATTYLADPYQALCLTAIEGYDQGYGGARHHHAYLGGLAVHVADVVRRCLELSGNTQFIPSPSARTIDLDVLLTAAYWHDYEKLSEYAWKATPGPFIGEFETSPDGCIEVTNYAKTTGHVVGSTYALLQAIHTLRARPPIITNKPKLPKLDAILHCMLSHHGRKEWGSPVEPTTNEAWILHSADMLSSRGAE